MSLLDVRGLVCTFPGGGRPVRPVDGIDLCIEAGEVLCLVGESGSGKSVTALSIMRLIELESDSTLEGEVVFRGDDLLRKSPGEMRALRGRDISMIFQEPMTAFNPILSIGEQLAQAVTYHAEGGRPAARARALEKLRAVGVPDPEAVLRRYPHQLSGGQRQRAMIAMALMGTPALLIADEPTTALDVTIQAQVLDLLRHLIDRTGLSVLFITHDMGVAAEIADRVAVMYAGQIVEEASAVQIFSEPLHPYTRGLLASVPPMEGERRSRLVTIGGTVPRLDRLPGGCRFQPRCGFATERCLEMPELRELDGRRVRCWHAERLRQAALPQVAQG